ncbi:MAG: glycosyltransferase family 4 protein [Vicinamibacteria bacterium]
MRILHVADRLTDRGGAYTWMLGVLGGLIEAGHDVRLAVGAIEGSVPAPCPVDVQPGLDARTDTAVELGPFVRSVGPDVIHVHNVMNPAVLEWAAGRPNALLTVQDHRVFCATRGKWTLAGEECRDAMARDVCSSCFENETHFRDVYSLTERRLAAVREMEVVTVLSSYMREELLRVGVPQRRLRIVPPFVHDLDHGRAPDGPPCVLFVGRLAATKGVNEALEAWSRSGVDLPMVIAGAGPLREALEARAHEAPGGRIEVPGWLDRESLSSLYRRARALVLPSRWQEPFGIAGIEALSFGVPVVAWESGGVGEWHPGPGLVRWGDVEALGRALAEAVTRRITPPPSYPRDEALGRLLVLYGRLARRGVPRGDLP